MSNFVTVDVITASGLGMKYSTDELERLAQSVENVREDSFLEDVFGSMSRLDSDVFITVVKQSATYMFRASELRAKLLDAAELDFRY